VTTSGDHGPEMSLTWLLDDETTEAVLRGDDEVDPRLERLVLFAKQVRDHGDGPPPPASPALLALIGSGGTGAGATGWRGRLRRRPEAAAGGVDGLRFAAKLGLGTAAAAVGMASAAAAGVLPGRADETVRHAIEAVTPVEFTDPAREHPENFGDRVSSDATGASDGENGVDGQEIRDEAPGAAHRRVDPGPPAGTGRAPGAGSSPGQGPPPHANAQNGWSDSALADQDSPPTTGPDSGGASGNHAPPDAPPGAPDARG